MASLLGKWFMTLLEPDRYFQKDWIYRALGKGKISRVFSRRWDELLSLSGKYNITHRLYRSEGLFLRDGGGIRI
ncbi:MAG: hypothetical protein COS92_07455 [Desulfobacterales bacterium CG07_land_8_20_14_0_80_52_14]|nr:MAG: hypothetical protein COX20_09925 [Desulfobacterales bacterium CG23_combo_of_CG06-09_8_20_14_all_52_9]PIU49263.1 MAG: hypothetical protein COS92_07455 [Desulfobacterales bacterium CG07_land_8_20_14_0_80_52_14]